MSKSSGPGNAVHVHVYTQLCKYGDIAVHRCGTNECTCVCRICYMLASARDRKSHVKCMYMYST